MMHVNCLNFCNLQKLDRAWYDFDGGYDETNNPFADIPEEYTKKKEEQMAKHAVKRMSAQQRQINKVHSLICSLSLSLSLLPLLFFSCSTTFIHVHTQCTYRIMKSGRRIVC